jgi:hypothetical protein
MEVGQGPNWGCSAKEKKYIPIFHRSNYFKVTTPFNAEIFIESRSHIFSHKEKEAYIIELCGIFDMTAIFN